MEQYVKYLRKSRFDRDYAEMSVEETLKRHEAILDKLAQDRGYHIAKSYYEVVSGESIAARPEIQKLLSEVSAGMYAGVLVVDLERLARGNSIDQGYISQVFQFSGTRIITPMKVYDPGNEFDEEYFEFGLFMSRREYKTINRRLIRGRDSSAAEGKYLGSIAPYGYRRCKLADEKGYTLEPDPEESQIVRKVFEMYIHYSGTKIIANYLNDNQVPTRHGDLWTYSTVGQMITNPVYMGKIRRGWSKQIRSIENGVVKKHIKRQKDMEAYQMFDALHPALISEDTFMEAQRIREERRPSAKVKENLELHNAFAGLIFCSVCGKRIGRTTSSEANNHRVRLRCVNGRNCHNVSADYDVVEKEIIDALRKWLEGYKVKIHTVGFADEIAGLTQDLERYAGEADRLNAQMENAFDLVEQGVYSLELFKTRRDKLNTALEELHRKQSQTQLLLDRLKEKEAGQSQLVPHTEELLDSYEQMTVPERNALLKEILQKIEYRKNEKGEITIDLFPRLPRL